MRIAINGFGRIGRSFFRLAFGDPKINIVGINDLADLENLAYLLEHDTVYGKYEKDIKTHLEETKKELIIDGQIIPFFTEKDPKNLPWEDLKIDLVIESTGAFSDYSKAKDHIKAGAKKVIITAPVKEEEGKEGRTVLVGINDEEFDRFNIISNGSCTTNAVAPVIKVLEESVGVEKAILNTVHAYTSTQRSVDSPNSSDWRRGRAASQNIIPSTTGAAKCVTKVIKSLENKFDGIALRVPVVCGSIADITFVSKKPTSVEEINEIFKKAVQDIKWKGILEIADDSLVSSDIVGTSAPAIIDLGFTNVVDKDLVKVLVWYDNEWAYSSTLLKQIKKI
ncbi:MAG: type I glyceraldehyde-3-phosphate dehydrogenase [Candidatus Pacebacteria bacterium]|nr:type I glyceraldehyde-3-phosphate dehydrogenase [Candidatus Paceibacterota bacterium]MDD5535286.1 type I glyceraldehyde-3-phosphate dehydrogenase [Candidatus Paceibacterota bacterium]